MKIVIVQGRDKTYRVTRVLTERERKHWALYPAERLIENGGLQSRTGALKAVEILLREAAQEAKEGGQS